MKKRTLTMATLLAFGLTVPLGKDYAHGNTSIESKLDSAIFEPYPNAHVEVGELLTPLDMLYLQYDTATIDSIANRARTPREEFVDNVLDTVSVYTAIVSKNFIKGSIKQESNYNPKAKSKAKARGLLQLMPDAWKLFGEGNYSNAYDSIKNIRAGIRYNLWLEKYISKRNPSWDTLSVEDKRGQILAAYNGGIGRLERKNWDVSKMPQESRDHIVYINDYIKKFDFEDEIIMAKYRMQPASIERLLAKN